MDTITKSPKKNVVNLVFFGPPGAGKGTQSKKLVQKYQLTHISPGELLRTQISQGTALAQQVAHYINEGKLAPNALVFAVIEEQLKTKKDGHGFLFDGFPRSIDQAKLLEEKLYSYQMQIDGAILLEVPEVELGSRLKLRAKLAGRVDDQDESKIATRMRIYSEETLPVAQYYAQQNKLFKVNGVGDIDTIFEHILAAMAKLQLV